MTQIHRAAYGIGIIEHDADLNAIINALADNGIEADEESTLNNVYVSLENVGEAVRLINELGYSTDEDEDQD